MEKETDYTSHIFKYSSGLELNFIDDIFHGIYRDIMKMDN